jgi:hypothetical protein
VVEEVKRLDPKLDVVRELFAKSGNECAFPGCTQRIIDSSGVVIGQICHIEAAEKGGPRFNVEMSNEDRRQFSNLMLMCYAHHKVTDDITKYPVSTLQQIKEEHEAKYTRGPEKLIMAIVDETKHTIATPARSLTRLDKELGWNYEDYQFNPVLNDLAELLGRLKQVPERTRQLLIVIVDRAVKADIFSGSSIVSLAEIQTACNLESQDLEDQLRILSRYGIARIDGSTADVNNVIRIDALNGPWDFWTDLKTYCKATGHSLEEFIISLRFDLLD